MSWNVMIVDDDMNFRYAMREMIPWQKNGFTVIAEAVHGKQALDYLAKDQVHIVLTDMDMPVMDGVELTKRIKTLYPDVMVIALSAYDDFSYVKESMRLGAEDYILKQDFDGNRIIESIKNICASYSSRWEAEMKRIWERRQFLQYLNGEVPDEPDTFPELKRSQRMTVCLASSAEDYQSTHAAGEAVLFMDKIERNTWVYICQVPFTGSVRDEMTFYNEAARLIRHDLREVTCVGLCDETGEIGRLPEMYRKALAALRFHFFSSQLQTIHYLDVREKMEKREENYVYEASEDHEQKKQDSFVKKLQWLSSVLIEKMPAEKCVDISLLNLCREWREVFLNDQDGMDFITFYEKLQTYNTLEEKVDFVMRETQRAFAAAKETVEHPVIIKAVHYIKKHYAEDLSLSVMAKYTGYNENYFSNLFRQEANESFTNYLNRIRIERAQRLLDDPRCKVYEAAEKVGFRNASYFSTMFKKVTGMSISDYRNGGRK